MKNMVQQAVTLSNSVAMPLIGFGTFKIRGQEVIFKVTEAALNAGYRSFDTAAVYRNEDDLGKAFKKYIPEMGLKREDLFITSKLGPKDHGYEACIEAFNLSLKRLQLEYLDLYLIHWPGVQKLQPEDPENQKRRNESWSALESLYKSGKVRAVGVSNYNISHLEDLLQHCNVVPHINQVEYHPHYQQKELKKYCDEHGIKIQAYSSLGTTVCNSPLLENSQVREVAKKSCRTPAQVLLRWATQKGVGVLPKSTNVDHIYENYDLNFDLSEEDYKLISSSNITKKYAWDSSVVI
ncbi:glyoxal reductase-like isoform X1 [Macrobrachium rosenbergii]|uniref:glyoxal reductase-like isoform X1 n=2 Tax=Macrobrachium rosenbergii TaxID=79674 RepID=UPI0034D5F80A